MIEAAVVIGHNGHPMYWHCPNESSGYIQDSRKLWEYLWDKRKLIAGIAHTHPGSGLPGPSRTDLTTFSAIERALGRRLCWWILSQDRTVLAQHMVLFTTEDLATRYGCEKEAAYRTIGIPEPFWAAELRERSEYGR